MSGQPLVSIRSGPLSGTLTVPGDKSVSHRSIILGGLAEGETRVEGLLEGEDVLRTIEALRVLGAEIEKRDEVWYIQGVGDQGPTEPVQVLDMGNSGTGARLLMGVLASAPFTSFMTGDASLTKRPMARVTTPLAQMGAGFTTRKGGKLPLAVVGTSKLQAIVYRLPVASAQVKSAVLLAGLGAEGTTTVIEPIPTRDHTEKMLKRFGANLTVEKTADGAEAISLKGRAKLIGQRIVVPGDISSAAFPIVATLIKPGSALTIRNVGVNPRRAGIVESLLEMGANLILSNAHDEGGEPVADIMVQASPLHGIVTPAERAPSMIDEFPVLAMAAACAEGTSRFCGLSELRVKESDRLALIAEGLVACGVDAGIDGDDLVIQGDGLAPRGGGRIRTAMDHRIAMSFLTLGTASFERVRIDDGSMIATSFPGFIELMNRLGASIAEA
jgi:3-phosphoshikimate 1-carboxyvinyltransferase